MYEYTAEARLVKNNDENTRLYHQYTEATVFTVAGVSYQAFPLGGGGGHINQPKALVAYYY
jgi:hypothetical protein